MKTLISLTAAALLWGGVAMADTFTDNIIASYKAAGFSNIAVQEVNGEWMVMAVKDGQSFSYIVDRATGKSTRVENGSMSSGDGDDDSDGADDSDDDNGSGSDDGGSHDSNDDKGGSDDSGSDDSGSDDKGSDDKGGDDN